MRRVTTERLMVARRAVGLAVGKRDWWKGSGGVRAGDLSGRELGRGGALLAGAWSCLVAMAMLFGAGALLGVLPRSDAPGALRAASQEDSWDDFQDSARNRVRFCRLKRCKGGILLLARAPHS